jgi:glucokinase
MARSDDGRRLYVGVDVGGTKIQASLVAESGAILGHERPRTPRDGGPERVLEVMAEAIEGVLEATGTAAGELAAVGVAVPGVVDPRRGRVVVTPNMGLTGADVTGVLGERLGVPIVLGNDCNLGTLGERWLGSARSARSAFGMFVGTGIGGGFVRGTKLWTGHREAAAEIGHIVMEIGGPECGCGNRGCFEAIAGRTAVERDLRAAVAAGRETVLTDLLEGDLGQVRSGALRRALEAGDELVAEVLGRAADVIGHACLTVRHLVDPEVIVVGGGVAEACGWFLYPRIAAVVEADRLPGAREGGRVLLSALGDDAVVLGAVALARMKAGRSPFARRFRALPAYPALEAEEGAVVVGGKRWDRAVEVRGSARVKKHKRYEDAPARIGPREVGRAVRGGAAMLYVGAGPEGERTLTDEAEAFLARRAIGREVLPTARAIEAYNASKERRAALLYPEAPGAD